MNDVQAVIKNAKESAVLALTGGEKVEPKTALVRKATSVEQDGYGNHVQYMVRCPGCSETTPVLKNKLLNTHFITTHAKYTPQNDEIVCAYGGEVIEFDESLI